MRLESTSVKNETQQNLKRMLELAHPDDALLLLMYGSPDPDAMASAMALRELFRQKKECPGLFLRQPSPFGGSKTGSWPRRCGSA